MSGITGRRRMRIAARTSAGVFRGVAAVLESVGQIAGVFWLASCPVREPDDGPVAAVSTSTRVEVEETPDSVSNGNRDDPDRHATSF